MRRREFLRAAPAVLCAGGAGAADRSSIVYPAVRRGRPLAFPRDHGAHPDYRTEWWYITGWLRDAGGRDYGVQVTFFRSRPGVQEDNRSAFAPRQILFAHAAIADTRHGRLRHDERVARAGFGLAEASQSTTDVVIDDWSLRLDGNVYRARIVAADFALELECRATLPVLAQGIAGFSRKGARPDEASYYYSRPHLRVRGELRLDSGIAVQGEAWLDHEWSSQYMAREASGWDWTGINLRDGAAVMAFRMRRKDGGPLWAAATYRSPAGVTTTYAPDQVSFEPLRTWRSPHSNAAYPVAMRVHVGAMRWELQPLMDDQELDSRASTGTIYWEGAVRALRDGSEAGRGYLELTGYWNGMRL